MEPGRSVESNLRLLPMQEAGSPPLLLCLAKLCKHLGKAYSLESLKAGLADRGDGSWGPSLFCQAAERIGLMVRPLHSSLRNVLALNSPAVLILDDNDEGACVVYGESEQGLELEYPNDKSSKCGTMKEVEKAYSGYALVIEVREGFIEENYHEHENESGKHWFWSALAQDWWVYCQVLIAAFLINSFALTSPLFIMNVYDRVVPNSAIETLWVLASGAAIVFAFDFILRSLRAYFIDSSGRKVDMLLAQRLYNRLLDMKLSLRPRSSGVFANTLKELESLRDFFTSASLASLVDLPFVFLFIGVCYLIAGPLAYIMMIAVGINLFLGLLVHYPLQRVVERSFRENNQKHSVLMETLSGLETIKSIRADGRMRAKWEDSVSRNARSSKMARFLSIFVVNASVLIQQFSLVAIVVGGVHLIKEGSLGQGALVACVILSGRALAPMGQVAHLLTRLHHALSSYRSLGDLMKQEVERPHGKKFVNRSRFSGQIQFKNVSFTYPGARKPSLEAVSFTIRPGEKVGIVGKTGSGKTTLEKLLLGLYEADEGSVCLDGSDLRQLDPVDYRRAVACVPQDVFLFSGTVRENISLSRPSAEDEEVLKASQVSGVHDFIRLEPEGYDLMVDERGRNLSGGQRQAISIARALLQDSPVLVMDEPSSAMDKSSEALLKERLKLALKRKTMILISHRASLLETVDRLIVLEEGRVVADGPRELVLKSLAKGPDGPKVQSVQNVQKGPDVPNDPNDPKVQKVQNVPKGPNGPKLANVPKKALAVGATAQSTAQSTAESTAECTAEVLTVGGER